MHTQSHQRESVLRDYLFEHPEILFAKPITSRQREVRIQGKFIDLLFEVDGVHHIVELKRDSITREAVGQVLEYYGRLRQDHPTRRYQIVLVAPNIPLYRSIPLEEFGIRCVEVSFPLTMFDGQTASVEPVAEASKVRLALNRSSPLADAENFSPQTVSLAELQPPCTQSSVRMVHKLLLDAIPKIQTAFAPFEVRPIAMARANQADILCLPLAQEPASTSFVGGGAWWAFAFGKSEQLAKNDTPNISVNSYLWGLDFAINAELRTSQQALLSAVAREPKEFDRIVGAHGSLTLQPWLKLEHQPRFYHWIPLQFVAAGEWNAATLLSLYDGLGQRYCTLREEWLAKIVAGRPDLSGSQVEHMQRTNKQMNLAIRFVKTFEVSNPIWKEGYLKQSLRFEREYIALKPLIEFFN